MLKKSFSEVYDKFKLPFYRRIFALMRERKGYLQRENSQADRREYYLVPTEKYHRYRGLLSSYAQTVMPRTEARIPPGDVQKFDKILRMMSSELTPACDH